MAHDTAHAIPHPTATGLDTRKLAIWTFIGSECLFFATLISNYLVYKGTAWSGRCRTRRRSACATARCTTCGPIFEIPLVTAGTAVLLFSSFFVVLALDGARAGNRKQLVRWLSATVFCGLFFVGMQVYEFTHFYHEGLGYTTNLFGSSFYHADRVPRHARHHRRHLAGDDAGARPARASCPPRRR